jgi:hypothetical protein
LASMKRCLRQSILSPFWQRCVNVAIMYGGKGVRSIIDPESSKRS